MEFQNTNPAMDWLVGGGEMGKRIRSFDWSKHPLGGSDGWSPSLKTVIRIMLSSRYAMWIGWGPEFYFFCNDAYLPTVGIKESWVLGAPARKVWPEIWGDIGPRAKSVVRTGEATWDESLLLFLERSGYAEETYHTFSYSPITDDSGAVGGMLCVVTEETERVIGARRLALLRELGSDLTATHTENEVFHAVRHRLGACDKDLPFALVYVFASEKDHARLVCAHGAAAGAAVAPTTIHLGSAESRWPAQSILAKGLPIKVERLETRFATVPTGSWDKPARQAIVVPIARQAQDQPAGFLVAGINPYRPFDAAYAGFIDLLAGQIAAALANARAYEEERKRAEALAELDKAKTAFFSNVSHEFRTPLSLVLGPIEDILRKPEGKVLPENREMLRVVHRNGQRLLKLVNTLLDFSRIEAGRVEAVFAPLDLASYTAELASVFRAAVEKAGLRLRVDCPPMTEAVFVDRDMWEKIVLNLVSNAFKYTLQGEISVSLYAGDGFAILSVRDTGTGIPQAELSKVFDRFHRIEGASGRTHEGTGIGLALVQELVKLHGGTIEVDSLLGEGSTFTVRIPLGKEHLPAERIGAGRALDPALIGAHPFVEEALRWLPTGAEEGERERPIRLAGAELAGAEMLVQGAGARIVLADDNADMRNYVWRLLAAHYRVQPVADGEAALAAIRRERPDLVLTDVMMPRLDGFQLLKTVRDDAALRDLPVLMLSARADEESKLEGFQAGADDYLVKPFSARELLARVGGLLALAKVRHETAQALRDSESRFRDLADNVPVMIWITEADGNCSFLSQSWYRFTGQTPETGLGRGWFDAIHPDDRGYAHDVFLAATGRREAFRLEHRLCDKDGNYRWSINTASPRFAPDGRYLGYIGSLLDISDRKAVEDTLKRADRRKDEFLANMSHEIRSPMTSILGYADILLSNLQDPDDIECVKTIKQSGNYLLEIINDILDLSKIESGKLTVQKELVSLPTLLNEIHSLMAVRAKEKGLPLILRYDGAIPESIISDRIRLRQILINLISNGIKFTASGNVQIISRFVNATASMQFEVSDTGIGISREMQERIFHPFTQADTSATREFGGTGLGLAITKRLVDMMGGKITFETEVKRGTTFRVTIPIGEVESIKFSIPWFDGSAASPERNLRLDCRVLVVDDRREIRYLVRQFIEDSGGRVVTVADGLSALEAVRGAEAEGQPIDVVLMDIQMPGLDGYETTRRLRALGFAKPIIGLTAGAMKGDREKCLAAGCDDYLTKPIDRSVLAEMVARYSAKALPGPPPAESSGKPRLKILLVDDNVKACRATGLLLEKSGHEVQTAFTGAAALTTARDFDADAVILDLKLPDMSGYEILKRLKAVARLQKTKFIALSGYEEQDVIDKSAPVKFHHFVTKPVDTTYLESLLLSD